MVAENAEKAYDENKKLRGKLNGAKKAIINSKEQITLAEKKKIKEEKIIDIEPIKKEKLYWFEKFRWFTSSDVNIIIGGKDAKTNEYKSGETTV